MLLALITGQGRTHYDRQTLHDADLALTAITKRSRCRNTMGPASNHTCLRILAPRYSDTGDT